MGLQSDVIGFRFGFGYEKGKRTLRAMSNEQFNNLDEEAEQAIYKRHDASAIHFFQQELNTWTQLQHLIIEKSVEIEIMKANRTPTAVKEIFDAGVNAHFNMKGSQAEQFVQWWKNLFGGIFGTGQHLDLETTHTHDTPPSAPISSPPSGTPGGQSPHAPSPSAPKQDLNKKIMAIIKYDHYSTINGKCKRISAGQKTIYYNFNFEGHKRKMLQIMNTHNTSKDQCKRKNYVQILQRYLKFTSSTYKGQTFQLNLK